MMQEAVRVLVLMQAIITKLYMELIIQENKNIFKSNNVQAIDKDNSGSIDPGELSKLGGGMSKEKLAKLMAKLDTDGDGKITLEEFRVLFKQMKQRSCSYNCQARVLVLSWSRSWSSHGQSKVNVKSQNIKDTLKWRSFHLQKISQGPELTLKSQCTTTHPPPPTTHP